MSATAGIGSPFACSLLTLEAVVAAPGGRVPLPRGACVGGGAGQRGQRRRRRLANGTGHVVRAAAWSVMGLGVIAGEQARGEERRHDGAPVPAGVLAPVTTERTQHRAQHLQRLGALVRA
eukprot:scaffold1564_cov389-Prasinococcus_capsulatus_cf.AAC.32